VSDIAHPLDTQKIPHSGATLASFDIYLGLRGICGRGVIAAAPQNSRNSCDMRRCQFFLEPILSQIVLLIDPFDLALSFVCAVNFIAPLERFR